MRGTDRRFQIEQGLDRMVSLGRALEFQILAHHTLKIRFPELVLAEFSHDGGEDSFILPGTDAHPHTPSVAASFTATLDKVRRDCARLRERGQLRSRILFITPKPVHRTQIDNWKGTIASEFDVSLEVVSRNGIVADLEQPSLSWLCREYLDVDDAKPTLVDIDTRARNAALLRTQAWEEQSIIRVPWVQLALRVTEGDKHSVLDSAAVDFLLRALRGATRVLLLGAPGGGKTVTLVQVARASLTKPNGRIPILIPAAEWAASHVPLMAFAATELGLTGEELVELDESGRLLLAINGWNEIADSRRSESVHELNATARRLPNTSILLSARSSSESPELPRWAKYHLEPLSRKLRQVIIYQAQLSDADSLLARIRHDEILDEITRTPLFLAVVLSLARHDRPLPNTLWSLLNSFVASAEEGLHSIELEHICKGQHRYYLSELARFLTDSGGASLRKDDALSVIGRANKSLLNAGIITQPNDAGTILRCLSSHHVLVITSDAYVRFLHQLFQAWAATEWLTTHLEVISSVPTNEAVASFQRMVLNREPWTDSLLLVTERLGHTDSSAKKAALRDLLSWMYSLDPLLTAQCVSRVPATWPLVREHVALTISALQRGDSAEERSYALALALATGEPDFRDLVWNLLEDNDSDVRLSTLRAYTPFTLRSLGSSWPARWSSWEPARRAEFASEIIMNGRVSDQDAIIAAVSRDEDSHVRMSTATSLDFVGNTAAAITLLGNDPALWSHQEAMYLVDDLTPEMATDLLPVLSQAADLAGPGPVRWRLLKFLAVNNTPYALDQLKAECNNAPPDQLARSLLPYLHHVDPEWCSNFVLDRIESNLTVSVDIARFATILQPERIRKLVRTALKAQLRGRGSSPTLALLANIAASTTASLVCEALRRSLRSNATTTPKSEHEFQHDLAHLLRALPLNVQATAVLDQPDLPSDPSDIRLLTLIFQALSPMSRRGSDDLAPTDRSRLRNMVLAASAFLASDTRYRRSTRADLAGLLGEFGHNTDAQTILSWAKAESDERRALLVKNDRSAAFSHSNWYAGSLLRLGSIDAFQALVTLLADPEFVGDASIALSHFALMSEEVMNGQIGAAMTLEGGSLLDRAREAVASAIVRHLANVQSGDREPYPFALGKAALALGRVGNDMAVDIILTVGQRPGTEWSAIEALEALAKRGVILPGKSTEAVLIPLLERVVKDGEFSGDGRWSFRMRCYALLLKSDSPGRGVELIRQLLPKLPSNEIRDLLPSLAECPSVSVESLLIELLNATAMSALWYPALVNALGSCKSSDASAALFQAFDNARHGNARPYGDGSEMLVKTLALRIRNQPSLEGALRERVSQASSSADRNLLAGLLRHLGGESSSIMSCDLLRDDDLEQIPYSVLQLVRDVTRRKEALSEGRGSYIEFPRSAPGLRGRLFDFLATDHRRISARRLLLTIELDRVETGRPDDENRYPGPIGDRPILSHWSTV